jgi:DNA polymerase-4
VRFADFTTITLCRRWRVATEVTGWVHRGGPRLSDARGLTRARLRVLGLRVVGLVPRATVHRQLVLGEPEHGWADADRAVDRATRRFGAAAVRPASLV